MEKPNKKKSSINNQTKEELLHLFDNYDFHSDIDLDLDKNEELIQLNPKIKDQLKDINDKIEILGKVCDKQYSNSYKMMKKNLDEENQKIDYDIKNYISNLRNKLIKFKNKLNFDYKGKYRQITKDLNDKVNELNKNIEIKNNLEKKFNVIKEDSNFYERQLDNIKDMNSYLKYKLKMMVKGYQKINNEYININEENRVNNGFEPNKKIIKKNDNDFLITGLQEYELNEDTNKNIVSSNNNKFSEEQISKVKKKFDYMLQKLYFDIENEKIEYANLKDVFDKLYIKTNNIYINILKNVHNEFKMNNSINNNSSNINNQSTLPSIYISTNNSNSKVTNKSGYMGKKNNKEIIINFLENEEIKKIIYKMLYDD